MKEGHRQQTPARNRGSGSNIVRNVNLTKTQKGADSNPSNIQATPYSELKARLSNNSQPTAQGYPKIWNELQDQLQRDEERTSNASSIASSAAIANIQEQLLANRRSEDMTSFCGRLSNVIQLLANEDIFFELPCIVLDHVAIHDLHMKHIICLVRRIASNGQQVTDDGIRLFKVKEVTDHHSQNGTETWNKMWMIIINCQEIKANHAIIKKFYQTRANHMMISAYAFDEQGCKYPDETITRTPLNVSNMRVRVRQRPNPVLIDFKDSNRPIYESSMQQVSSQPALSYTAIVKGNSNIKLNATSKSTLKSTSDLQSQVAIEPSSKTMNKVNPEP